MMRWYVYLCSLLVTFDGFLWGYETGSINGVKEMPGFRRIMNISSPGNGTCVSSSDDVETSALLGVMVTVLHIGCLISTPFAGVLSDAAGRKIAIISGAVCFAIGAVINVGAVNIWMVFVGRITVGLGLGVLFQVCPLYIAEISPKELRGGLIFLISFYAIAGVLLGNVVNAVIANYLTSYDWGWRITLSIQAVASTGLSLGAIFIPETPRWLVKKHRPSKALHVLKRIHQDESKAQSDLEEIKTSINTATKMNIKETIKFLFHCDILERLAIGFFFQFFGRFGGSVFMLYYSVTLFCHIGVDAYVASIAMFSANIITQFTGVFIVDKAGRKPVLLIAGVFMVLFVMIAATLTLVFNLEENSEYGLSSEETIIGYVIIALVILFWCFFSGSYGIIPFIVNSEIFPLQIRGVSVAISLFGWWGGTIIVSQLTPILITSPLGSHGNFYIIGGVGVLLMFFVLFLIPETKGKSLEEIDLLFREPWYQRADILYYLSCGLTKRLPACRKRIAVKVTSSVETEDSEELLSLTSDSVDSETATCSSSLNNSEDGSETTL